MEKKRVISTFTWPVEWLITLPPFSLVMKKRVALFRKLGVIRHGLQSGEDLLEHWPFLNWQKKKNCSVSDSSENIHMLFSCMLM